MERCMENMTEKTVPAGQVVGTVFDNQSKYEKKQMLRRKLMFLISCHQIVSCPRRAFQNP